MKESIELIPGSDQTNRCCPALDISFLPFLGIHPLFKPLPFPFHFLLFILEFKSHDTLTITSKLFMKRIQ